MIYLGTIKEHLIPIGRHFICSLTNQIVLHMLCESEVPDHNNTIYKRIHSFNNEYKYDYSNNYSVTHKTTNNY